MVRATISFHLSARDGTECGALEPFKKNVFDVRDYEKSTHKLGLQNEHLFQISVSVLIWCVGNRFVWKVRIVWQ